MARKEQDRYVFPAGTPLEEIPVDYHGISWYEWRMRTNDRPANYHPEQAAAVPKKAAATKRDGYGMRGVRNIRYGGLITR